MGFLSGAFDAIGSIAGPIADIAGGFIASRGAERAAERSEEAQLRGLEQQERLSREAIELLGPLLAQGRTGTRRLESITARAPDTLTPLQHRVLGDVRRQGRAEMANAGTRSAGRAGILALQETEARFRERAAQENRARADRAAEILAAREPAAISGQANILSGLGSSQAGLLSDIGTTRAAGITGQANAQGAIAGGIGGLIARLPDTFSAIRSAMSADQADAERRSAYGS